MSTKSSSDGIIRAARSSDIPQIVLLWRMLQDVNAGYDSRLMPNFQANEWFRDFLQRQETNQDVVVYVAEHNHQIVGYILGQILYRPTLEVNRCGYIADLFVREDYRVLGIGRSLYQTQIQWFISREIVSIEVQVVRANPASQAFWRKMGFSDFLRTLRKEM